MVPVEDAVVESELDAVFPAGFIQFGQNVPPFKRRTAHIKFGVIAVPKTKSIVVLGCDDQVFHARRLGRARDQVGIKLRRIKILDDLRIFFPGNLQIGRDPF